MKISDILSTFGDVASFESHEIPAEDVEQLLQASLQTMKNRGNTCELYVTDDRKRLVRLADARESGGESLLTAPLAVAIVADRLYDGAWVENCSAALWALRCRSAELGIASNAVQIRGYSLADGVLADEVVRGVLDIPDGKTVYAVVALGYPVSRVDNYTDKECDWGRIYIV